MAGIDGQRLSSALRRPASQAPGPGLGPTQTSQRPLVSPIRSRLAVIGARLLHVLVDPTEGLLQAGEDDALVAAGVLEGPQRFEINDELLQSLETG